MWTVPVRTVSDLMLLSPDTLWRNHEWQEVRHGSGVSLLTWSHVRKLTAARRCKNRTVWSDNKLILWPLFQHNPCDLVSALLKKSVSAVTISRLAMHSLQLLLYLRCVKSMVTSLPLHIEKLLHGYIAECFQMILTLTSCETLSG